MDWQSSSNPKQWVGSAQAQDNSGFVAGRVYDSPVPISAGSGPHPTLKVDNVKPLPRGKVTAGVRTPAISAQDVVLQAEFQFPEETILVPGAWVSFTIEWLSKTREGGKDVPRPTNVFSDNPRYPGWGFTIDVSAVASATTNFLVRKIVADEHVRHYMLMADMLVRYAVNPGSKIKVDFQYNLDFGWTKDWDFFSSAAMTVVHSLNEYVPLVREVAPQDWERLSLDSSIEELLE